MHHVLLELTAPTALPRPRASRPQVQVLEGMLQCPESGRLVPISRGIPNMLLSDEESES